MRFILTIIKLHYMQARIYVRNEEIPVQEKLEDISWIKDVTNSYNIDSITYYFTDDGIAVLILLTYFLLNLLILIFTVLYLGKILNWIKQSKLKDVSASVLTFINLATFVIDITFHSYAGINDFYSITKLFLVVLIFILDISISCFITRKDDHKCKGIHALALCQFVWFVHRLAIQIPLYPSLNLSDTWHSYASFIASCLCNSFFTFLAQKMPGSRLQLLQL